MKQWMPTFKNEQGDILLFPYRDLGGDSALDAQIAADENVTELRRKVLGVELDRFIEVDLDGELKHLPGTIQITGLSLDEEVVNVELDVCVIGGPRFDEYKAQEAANG